MDVDFLDIFCDRCKECTAFITKCLDYFASIESPEDISQRRELDKSEERAKRKVLALVEELAETGQRAIRESLDVVRREPLTDDNDNS